MAEGCGEDVWGGGEGMFGEGRIGMGCWRWEIWGIRSIEDRKHLEKNIPRAGSIQDMAFRV